jgi:Tfp pilus assembly protein PilN
MRPVNLIPPDERRGDSAPLRTGPLVYVLVGAMGLLLLGIVAVALTGKQVSDREAEKSDLQHELAQTQAQANSVKAFTDFAQAQQSQAQTISTLAQSRFDWSRVMHELSLVLPSGVSLNSLSGTVSSDSDLGGGSSTSDGPDLRGDVAGPALQISGCAPNQDTVASFVAALEEIDGVTRVGLSSSKMPEESASAPSGEPGDAAATGESCPDVHDPKFSIVVAFDKVPPPGTSTPPPPPPSTSAAASNSPAGEVQAQNNVVKASLDKTSDRAHDVLHAIGTGG